MTRIACQSAALARIIVPWAAMIAELFSIIIGLVAANGKNVLDTLHEPGAHGLACKLSPEFGRAVMMDLGGKRKTRIKALFAKPSAPAPSRRLMTAHRNDAAKSVLLADIAAALAWIGINLADAERKVVGRERH